MLITDDPFLKFNLVLKLESKPYNFLCASNHTIIWICPSVCLFHISSGVYWPISTKLCRKVGGRSGQNLKTLVAMATNTQPWQRRKCGFLGQMSHENHIRPCRKKAWARREMWLSHRFPWQPSCCHGNQKAWFYGQIRIADGQNIVSDIIDDITLPMMSWMQSPWQYGNTMANILWCLRHLGAIALLMMAENATFPSVCAGESQSGNPIGSALVGLIRINIQCQRSHQSVLICINLDPNLHRLINA